MSLKYKCLIAEDNLLDRDVLEMYISKIPSLKIEAVCNDGLEAAAALQKQKIDIVFSDIDMPNLTGMELLQSLKQAPVFVFISSYAEHAAESYSLDVIDFIVKPVTLARLMKAANKAIEYIELKKKIEPTLPNSNLSGEQNVEKKALDTLHFNDHFFIKENYDYIKIAHEDVLYIESMGNFSRLNTIKNKKHITLVSLKSIEAHLAPQNFMRVHKQYIINLKHIVSLSSNGEVILSGGHAVPLSINHKADLMEIINKKILVR
ncbi:MAG: LytTR family DNA-binding domain-containing protein [Ferruginibacter sp.]|nr:LytTR family DNA-binding domain-containing protein [Ferruginibacter sp.]